MNQQTTTRTCVICRWRDLPDTRPHVCQPCEDRIRRQLDWLDLHLPLVQIVARTEPTRTGELDLGAMDLTLTSHTQQWLPVDPDDNTGNRPVASVLGSWFETWSGRDVITLDASGTIAAIHRAVRWACRVDADMPLFAADLRRVYAQTRQALHRDLRHIRYAAPCPDDGGELTTRPGADWIRCDSCRRLFDEDQYAELARGALPATALLHAHEVATALGVEPASIRQLIWRRRLVPFDHGDAGRPRYELTHVRQVADEIRLYKAQAGQIVTWRGEQRHIVEAPAGTRIQFGTEIVKVRRGRTIDLGQLADGQTYQALPTATRQQVPA